MRTANAPLFSATPSYSRADGAVTDLVSQASTSVGQATSQATRAAAEAPDLASKLAASASDLAKSSIDGLHADRAVSGLVAQAAASMEQAKSAAVRLAGDAPNAASKLYASALAAKPNLKLPDLPDLSKLRASAVAAAPSLTDVSAFKLPRLGQRGERPVPSVPAPQEPRVQPEEPSERLPQVDVPVGDEPLLVDAGQTEALNEPLQVDLPVGDELLSGGVPSPPDTPLPPRQLDLPMGDGPPVHVVCSIVTKEGHYVFTCSTTAVPP